MTKLHSIIKHIIQASLPRERSWGWVFLLLFSSAMLESCIEPPLHLPSENVMVEWPDIVTDIKVVWDIDADWHTNWYYGWDDNDRKFMGDTVYSKPQAGYEVRRYPLGEKPLDHHVRVDKFQSAGERFTRPFEFGFHDLLIWSRIYSPEGTQVVTVNDQDLDMVTASTTITRAISLTKATDANPTALYNQPEIFYSGYARDLYISRNYEDYDYYDEDRHVWVKKLETTLQPLVYIYLVQIILYNNDNGRVKSISGDCAISAMASGTNVNTGHTFNNPCMVYFNTRMKRDIQVEGQRTDIIGGRLTTYGLCDMEGFKTYSKAIYRGSRTDLPNYLFFDLNMSKGSVQTVKVDVTEQCRQQCHGGIITVWLDCSTIDDPGGDPGSGSLFHPTVEDYENLEYDIPM